MMTLLACILIRNHLALLAIATCVSVTSFGETKSVLGQLRQMLRDGVKDGGILHLLFHDGIVGYMAAASAASVAEDRSGGGKQQGSNSSFFTNGIGGEGKISYVFMDFRLQL